jgi:hypothetical protein
LPPLHASCAVLAPCETRALVGSTGTKAHVIGSHFRYPLRPNFLHRMKRYRKRTCVNGGVIAWPRAVSTGYNPATEQGTGRTSW